MNAGNSYFFRFIERYSVEKKVIQVITFATIFVNSKKRKIIHLAWSIIVR